jgi:uncharacterized Zn-finger protein
VKCKACHRNFKGNRGLVHHIIAAHGVHPKVYYDVYDQNFCPQCGNKIYFRTNRHLTLAQKFCSNRCAANSRAKGFVNDHGYREIPFHWFTQKQMRILGPMTRRNGNGQYILEHRAVLALKLRRPLLSTEQAHHRNGNRLDNQPSNLELRVGNHGSGATGKYLICPHCKKRYSSRVAA